MKEDAWEKVRSVRNNIFPQFLSRIILIVTSPPGLINFLLSCQGKLQNSTYEILLQIRQFLN